MKFAKIGKDKRPCPKCGRKSWYMDARSRLWRCHDNNCAFTYINGQNYSGYVQDDGETA